MKPLCLLVIAWASTSPTLALSPDSAIRVGSAVAALPPSKALRLAVPVSKDPGQESRSLSTTIVVADGRPPIAAFGLSLSLDEIASRVHTHNAAIKSARLAVDEAKGRLLNTGRLSNPAIGYDLQTQSAVSPQTAAVSLDQTFPLTRRLSLERQLSAQLITAANLEVQDAERRLLAEAKSQAVRLMSISRQQQLRQQQIDLAQKLADFAKTRAQLGEVSSLDAKQVQLDAQKHRIESRLLQAESISILGRLKPMLGLQAKDTLTITGGLPTLQPPPNSAWQQRPDYLLSQAKAQAAKTGQQLARAKRIPDVTAGLFGSQEMQNVSSTRRERTGFLGLRFSIPLPLWNRNQGEIAEKDASAQRAALETQSLAAQIGVEADTALQEMEINASVVRETRDSLVPLAVKQADEMQKAYEKGQADLLSTLRSRDQCLQLESAALNAEQDFHLARIRYEAATGSNP